MNLIRLKIPTSAPFIPMVVGDYTTLGGCYERDCCFSAEEIFHNSFSKGHTVRKGIERPLTECFENRVITVDDDISVTYSYIGWDQDNQYRPVIMTLRDYYIKYVDEYLHEYTAGYNESNILSQWMENPASGFNHIVKPSRNSMITLRCSTTGIGGGLTIIPTTDDIKITVSLCR